MHRRALPAVLACGLLTASACSDESPPPTTESNLSGGNGICIQTQLVDHTEIPDDSTIIFHMKGGVAWKNSLKYACTSLKIEAGFTFLTDFPEVCSNGQTIQVLHSGILCELGQFTPYMPQPAAPPAK